MRRIACKRRSAGWPGSERIASMPERSTNQATYSHSRSPAASTKCTGSTAIGQTLIVKAPGIESGASHSALRKSP